MQITYTESKILYPAQLLERALDKYYPGNNLELYCEPFSKPNTPHWAFDNYRTGGSDYKESPLFYTQPGWGSYFESRGRTNIKCVTYACDPEIHKPVECKKEFDVGFIGRGCHENSDRDTYLEAIKNNFNAMITDTVSTEDLGKEYSKCKVIFNHIRWEEVNIRFFEGLALGAQVCSYTPALHYFAVEGKHYLTFKSVDEAIEKVRYLLQHDDVREKMAINARKHALEYHTYKHRAEEMLSFLDKDFYAR